MASTKTKKKAKSIKVGIIGPAEMTAKAVKSTMTEFMASQEGDVSFVLPLRKDLFGKGIQTVADYLIDKEIPYEVIGDPTALKSRNLKPYATNATEQTQRERGYLKKFVQTVAEGDESLFLVLMPEDDDDDVDATLDEAFKADMTVLALNQGLSELEQDGDDEDEDDKAKDADEEEDDAEDADEEDDADEADDSDEDEADDADDEDEKPSAKKSSSNGKASSNGSATTRDVLRTLGQALLDTAAEL